MGQRHLGGLLALQVRSAWPMSLPRLLGAVGFGVPLLGLMMPVGAQVIPDALRACRAQSDDTRRLQCYDHEVDRHAPTQAPAPVAVAATISADSTAAVPAATPPANPKSGDTQAAASAPATQPAPARLPLFKARITALSFRPSGEMVVSLDNGQVWTQYVAQGKVPLSVGDTVTIRPGWLGTHLLVGPSSWLTKVHELAAVPP